MHVQSWIPQWIAFSNQNNFDRIYSKGQKIIIIFQKLVSINQIRLIITNSWLPKRLTHKVNPKCESTGDSDQF